MSGKNYGDLRHLAMGHLSHEEIANKLLQMNATNPELTSVLRGGHDRIQHFLSTAVVATNDSEIETLRRQLTDAEARNQQFSIELTSALSNVAVEKERANGLQGEVNRLSGELQHIRDTYDLSDEEDDGEDGIEEETSEMPARVGYMPNREEIKEIATANGFRVRQQSGGKEDLADYVYVTIEKTVQFAHDRS